jgi:hypothetical protein
VKRTFRVVIVALLLAAVLPLQGQLPRDPEERKKVLAQIFEANARQLTLFMTVDITTTPTFQAGTPKLLFKMQGPLPGNPGQWKNVSRDGQRFIFAMPTTAATGPR